MPVWRRDDQEGWVRVGQVTHCNLNFMRYSNEHSACLQLQSTFVLQQKVLTNKKVLSNVFVCSWKELQGTKRVGEFKGCIKEHITVPGLLSSMLKMSLLVDEYPTHPGYMPYAMSIEQYSINICLFSMCANAMGYLGQLLSCCVLRLRYNIYFTQCINEEFQCTSVQILTMQCSLQQYTLGTCIVTIIFVKTLNINTNAEPNHRLV